MTSHFASRSDATRRYKALETLAGWYTVLAVMSIVSALILCIMGVAALSVDAVGGLTAIIISAVAGAISAITLLALAQGITLMIHVAEDLRVIREEITKDTN